MTNTHTVPTMDVHALKKHYDLDSTLCILDVRELDEWQDMHIPNALHIPQAHVSDTIESRVPDKNHPIYVHCRGGVRSLSAAQCLINKGYTHVYSVQGGLVAWAKEGFPVTRPQGSPK